jgi:hypothetical protein
MSAESLLQIALVAAIKADPALSGYLGARVYDHPPRSAAYPYLCFGPSDDRPDDDIDDLHTLAFAWQIDVYVQAQGNKVDCRNICAAVRTALKNIEIDLGADALVFLSISRSRIIGDPDPTLTHGIITLEGEIELNG